MISPKDWHGKDASGRNAYEHGNMYWSGTVDAVIDIPKGASAIKIKAFGTPAKEEYPYMVVELDGREIGDVVLGSAQWREYSFSIEKDSGARVVSVTFLNDYCAAGEDRNLIVGEARAE